MLTIYDVIKKPVVTEKGHDKREQERTLCFAVDENANKTQIKSAVETLFKVKVEDV
jgi:large subunit ribosomal protein L23